MIDAASQARVSRIEDEARILQGLHGGRLIRRAAGVLLGLASHVLSPRAAPAHTGLRLR